LLEPCRILPCSNDEPTPTSTTHIFSLAPATPSRFQHTRRVSIPPDLQKLSTSQKSARRLAFCNKTHGATFSIAVPVNKKPTSPAILCLSPKISELRPASRINPQTFQRTPERRQPKSSGGGAIVNGL
jgi:hypothetical protein